MFRESFAALFCLCAAVPASAQVTRVSVSTAGVEANAPSGRPSISGTGRYVVFASAATNLVAGDTNNVADIFLRDRDTDADGIFDEAGAVATTRVSVGAGGVQADNLSRDPFITADGRFVFFGSLASNLVPGGPVGYALYRFESNARAATVLGLIGAGGIGQLLFDALNGFAYSQVGAIAIVIVAAVSLIDLLSQAMRSRLL